jgi:hypothetical protein
LQDFDLAVSREAEKIGLPADNQRIGPEAVLGIEINPYAAELARLTVWITEIQWQLRNGFGIKRSPVLGKLDGIVCRDALVNRDGSEAEWPNADVVIGNPPFLGGKRMRTNLGDAYVEKLFSAFATRVQLKPTLLPIGSEKHPNISTREGSPPPVLSRRTPFAEVQIGVSSITSSQTKRFRTLGLTNHGLSTEQR